MKAVLSLSSRNLSSNTEFQNSRSPAFTVLSVEEQFTGQYSPFKGLGQLFYFFFNWEGRGSEISSVSVERECKIKLFKDL